MNDVETIQGARGWRECSEHNGFWLSPQDNHACVHPLPDPLADTPEGWWEFGQILKWADERGWLVALDTIGASYASAILEKVAGWRWMPFVEDAESPDFRAVIIAALAAAVRNESEVEG